MITKNHRSLGKKNVIIEHFFENIKKYVVIIIFFLIGVILGTIFINNVTKEQQIEITSYINNSITLLKENNSFNKGNLFIRSVEINLLTALALWVSGCTVIGVPIIYGIIGYRGFCFGYGVSSIIATLGTKNGIIVSISAILIHNILIIPAIFIISVSGINLYKSIMKYKEDIKLEMYRHSILTIIMSVVLILASIIETYISSSITAFVIKYI